MSLGIKESLRYRDIEWLMEMVDIHDLFSRLKIPFETIGQDEVGAKCPDHYLFVGKESSHPNWRCNLKNGKTVCNTEPRGSNLLWTVARLLDCEPSEAVKFMTGKDEYEISDASILLRRLNRPEQVDEKKEPVNLYNIRKILSSGYISQRCYDFFMHPPGKKPTLIRKETVDRFKVVESTSGYYSDRAIIPFFMEQELCGFCAIDLAGKSEWTRNHPSLDEKEYRKVLYPLNMGSGDYVFGYDECMEQKGARDIIIVEGAREKMKLYQEGFLAIALLKCVMSKGQKLLLAKLNPSNVFIMFDGDEAGWRATDILYEDLSRQFNVKKCYLPVGKDPKNLDKDFIKKLLFRSLSH